MSLEKLWCGRRDLNPHAFRRHPLKMVCLPIPPLPLYNQQLSLTPDICQQSRSKYRICRCLEGSAQPVPDIVPDNLHPESNTDDIEKCEDFLAFSRNSI